jgi:RNA polymerase sigma-70 factor, ECF subfamily
MPAAGDFTPDQAAGEAALARRARAGDVAAFGELVRLHQVAVFNVCYRLTGERREAEDMAQDAFIRAYERFASFDTARPFGPWMRRVAANVCLNALQRARRLHFSLDDDSVPEPRADEAGEPPVAHGQRETAETVRAALLALPAHYRAVIELCHFQDMSYAEAAQELRLPLSDVKSHLFRARNALAKQLRPIAAPLSDAR